MDDQAKINYLKGLERYSKNIEEVVEKNYDVQPQYVEILTWGYTAVAYFIRAVNGQKYLAKVTDYSPEKEKRLLKAVCLSAFLDSVITTTRCFKNLSGQHLTVFEDVLGSNKILKLSTYIDGAQALEMDWNILDTAIKNLKIIHTLPTDNLSCDLPKLESPKSEYKLLHGDLTPQNILVYYGKVTGILDFEEMLLGPVEYDLARTAVFCWFRMADIKFAEVLKHIMNSYEKSGETDGSSRLDKELFWQYSKEHAQKHLHNVEGARAKYDKKGQLLMWEKELRFSQERYVEIIQCQVPGLE